MQVPSILQGESLTRLLQGAAIGAVATNLVVFEFSQGFTAQIYCGGVPEKTSPPYRSLRYSRHITVVGFSWGGWSLGSTADKMAKEQSNLAVVAALAPVCADKFRAQPDAAAKTVALSKVDSWKRSEEFSKELVTLPGETYPSSALVAACYALLMAPKSAALQ
jgi:hypothetical protein